MTTPNDQPLHYAESESAGRGRRPWRLQFSLAALMLFVTLCCLVLGWWFRPQPYGTEALFHVNAVEPRVLGSGNERFDAREFDLFRNTQVEYVTSHHVLQAAVNDLKSANVPRLQSQEDPVAWLAENIEAEFPGDGELMAIRLRGREHTTGDDRLIVDAVAQAYIDEVVLRRRNQRLRELDKTKRMQDRLKVDLREQQSDYVRMLSEEAGNADQEEGGVSGDLKQEQAELNALMETYQRLSARIQATEIELQAPGRVTLVQSAYSSQE